MRGPDADVLAVAAEVLGRRIIATAGVAGGDVNQAYRLRLDGGLDVFVKTNRAAPVGVFAAEADGLRWLGETDTVRVPKVLAVRDDPDVLHRFLVLSWVEPGPPAADHDEQLGRALAALHRFPCPRVGLERDNWIGLLPQPNTPAPTWPAFYAEQRLLPLTRTALDAGRLASATATKVERVCARLDDLCGPAEEPSRLHGDLWGGNAMVDERGRPVLVDPAAYGGHREIDLAMMRLFGGFADRVFAAYAEAFPLAPGHHDRVELYQLYPLLVHVHLFGGSYASAVDRAASRYV